MFEGAAFSCEDDDGGDAITGASAGVTEGEIAVGAGARVTFKSSAPRRRSFHGNCNAGNPKDCPPS